MIPALLVLAAVAIVLWPTTRAPTRPLAPSDLAAPTPPRPPHPSYQSAIGSLAQVRHRLAQTEQLSEDAVAAINILTLALVAGSDRE